MELQSPYLCWNHVSSSATCGQRWWHNIWIESSTCILSSTEVVKPHLPHEQQVYQGSIRKGCPRDRQLSLVWSVDRPTRLHPILCFEQICRAPTCWNIVHRQICQRDISDETPRCSELVVWSGYWLGIPLIIGLEAVPQTYLDDENNRGNRRLRWQHLAFPNGEMSRIDEE